MSTKYNGIVVTLEDDYNEEYVDKLVTSILLMKGVTKVEKSNSSLSNDYFAKSQIKQSVIKLLYELMDYVNSL